MADDEQNLSEDDLNSLLEQLGEMENLDFNLNGLSQLDLEEMGKSLSEDELDMLLLDNEISDSLDEGMKDLDFLPKIPGEEGEEGEEGAEDEGAQPEQAPPGAEPEAEASETDPAEAPIAAEAGPDIEGARLSETEQGTVQDAAKETEKALKSDADDDDDTFDFLKELVGDGVAELLGDETEELSEELQDALIDAAQDEELDEDSLSDGSEDDVMLPDFGFNESFTTVGEGRAEVVRSDEMTRREKRKRKAAPKKKKREKLNFTVILLERLPPPVRSKVEPIIQKVATKRKERKPLSKTKKMIVAIILMLIALVASSILLFSQYRTMRRVIEENKVIARTPRAGFNSANYVFANNKKPFNGTDLTLRMLLLDQYMCAFYFDRYIPMDKSFGELRDDLGNYYSIYRSLTSLQINPTDETEPTVLWFDGIKPGAEELYLTIWDSETKETAEYEIDMRNYVSMVSEYLTAPKGIRIESDSFNMTVEEAAFSSAMSSVVYKITEKEGVDIIHGITSSRESGMISLENTGSSAAPLLPGPIVYKVNDDISVARMDFYPVKNLDNKMRFTFRDLYRYIELNRFFNSAPLFEADGEMRIETDEGQLVLEGVKKFGSSYVLVYHFLDKNGEKTVARVDAEMVIRTYTGLEINLDAVARFKTDGGDMIFSYESPNSIIDNTTPENVYLNIKSVMLSKPDAITDISAAVESTSPEDASYYDVKEFAKEAFLKRLSLKSGETEAGALDAYFDEAIVSDNELGKLYVPKNVTEPPEYSVMVTAAARLSRFEYFLVVEEAWLGILADERNHYYSTHKIIIKQIDDKFVITSDEVIAEE